MVKSTTITPKIYTESSKKRGAPSTMLQIYSMDDENLFGKVAYRKNVIEYSSKIAMQDIPSLAYKHIVNSKSAIK